MTELHDIAGEPTTVFERKPNEMELRDVHDRDVAIVHEEVPSAEIKTVIGAGLEEIDAAGREAGVGWAGPPFVRYLDWSSERIVLEVGVPVLRPMPQVGRVGPGRLPGGRVATMVHVGPYETISATYGLLMGQLAARGLEPLGPMWEVYWSDPQAEPDPATWRTEIFVPVR